MSAEEQVLSIVRAPSSETGRDTPTYCADLDWFYNCAESEAGYGSSYHAGAVGESDTESNWYTKRHLNSFARDRKIFAIIRRVPGEHQMVLHRYYEPRQNRQKLPDAAVAAAHNAFYAARGAK